MKEITRRQFGKVAAATAALAGVSLPEFSPHSSFAQQPGGSRQFPPGFVWGCATAAYQIEGGVHEGGRGASIWDVFSHTPGKTYNGDTGDVADDSYHLYKDDVRLLKNLGVRAYRMSIAWSRIFPNGTGQPSQAGLDYYKRVLDELLENNIAPFVTLFHWDLPAALPGGWQSRSTALAYADWLRDHLTQGRDRHVQCKQRSARDALEGPVERQPRDDRQDHRQGFRCPRGSADRLWVRPDSRP